MLKKLKSKLREGPKPEHGSTPRFVDERFTPFLANTIWDWQLVNGVLLKYSDKGTMKSTPVGLSLLPTEFPRRFFEQAHSLQMAYNELYAKVSSDEKYLLGILEDVSEEDELVRALIYIYLEAKAVGFDQDLVLGIFRSDYMLHQEQNAEKDDVLTLKQVEFNTIAVAGGCHATHAAEMHTYLARTGAFQQEDPSITSSMFPPNPTIRSIVSALASAHAAYGPPKSDQAKETAILMIVQPFNFNIADERPLEYALWNLNPPVPTYRCLFQPEVTLHTSLTPTGELLYHPPSRIGLHPLEISVAYLRAGLDANEYDTQGIATRLHLEKSLAIKCPDILCHLAGSKVVQQALSQGPDPLTRFIWSPDTRAALAATFGTMHRADTTELGTLALRLAQRPEIAAAYVLKPCREGGGHNLYRDAIAEFLRTTPESAWRAWILMGLFRPPRQVGKLLLAAGEIYAGDVVSELGVFGTCLWRRSTGVVLENWGAAGWSFKTKPAHVDEMSVVKGYGCFDCPRLVDDEKE